MYSPRKKSLRTRRRRHTKTYVRKHRGGTGMESLVPLALLALQQSFRPRYPSSTTPKKRSETRRNPRPKSFK